MTNSSKHAAPQPPPAGAAKAAPSAYSRFIPREELGDFAAWSPDSLHGALDGEPPAPPAAAAANAPSPATQALLDAARSAGYQDGYRDGLVALDSFKQSFATQTSARIGQLVQDFGRQIDALEQDIARAIAQAAVLLARRVVRVELHSHPEQVAHAAQQAVDAVLLSARHIRVLVHPDDHALVEQGAAEALAARGARLLAQPDIERGGCVVESDLGQIDARIESRWRAAAAVLGSDVPWSDDEKDVDGA